MANDFLTFAGSVGANVMTQSAYASLTARSAGFVAGTAQSPQLNKVWRQSSIMSAALAQLIADNTGADVLDDGTITTILPNLKLATKGRLLKTTVITASGTFTPLTTSTLFHVRGAGGGGGSGGSAATAAGTYTTTGGGASGGYSEGWFTAAQIGSSIAVTIGTAGAAGAVGPNNGGNGGATSLGSLMVIPGGGGAVAVASTANSNPALSLGGTPGAVPTGGSVVNMAGVPGTYGVGTTTNGLATSGVGGSNPLGAGGNTTTLSVPAPGTGYGAGASGAVTPSSFAARAGAAGTAGVLVIEEYA